jgi:putative tryptophan/tyrosine transport system substrate-binding protein
MLSRWRLPAVFLLAVSAALRPAVAGEATVLIATWRGCEDACRGVQDHLAERGHAIDFLVLDAGQQAEAIPAILAEARAAKVDLIVSWGTSVTRGIAGDLSQLDDPAFNHEIPQVFMIVADPVGSGIVASLDATGRPNLTGTYNRMPETVTIQTIRSYLPGFRRLGLLYNENEPNSVLKFHELAELAEQEGFELAALPISLDQDGMPLVEDIGPKVRQLALADVDFLYMGSSSFLLANRAILGAAAVRARMPILSPYEEAVADGNALVSVAARYREIGRLAGRQVEAILFDGSSPGDLPVLRMTEFAVTINLAVAKAIDLFPPVDILQIADIIE